jgi:hypothetical protein
MNGTVHATIGFTGGVLLGANWLVKEEYSKLSNRIFRHLDVN